MKQKRLKCIFGIIILIHSPIFTRGQEELPPLPLLNENSFNIIQTIDFDQYFPDRTYTHGNGEKIEYGYDKHAGSDQMGIITLPPQQVGSYGWGNAPYASFQTDYRSKVNNTTAAFYAYIPGGTEIDENPYFVLAVSLDGGSKVDSWIVGGPEDAKLSGKSWKEYILDEDSMVHVSQARPGLGWDFTPENYGRLGDLYNHSMMGEKLWGEAEVLFLSVAASNQWSSRSYSVYIDDIRIGSYREMEQVNPWQQFIQGLLEPLINETSGTVLLVPFLMSNGEYHAALNQVFEELQTILKERNNIQLISNSLLIKWLQEEKVSEIELKDVRVARSLAQEFQANYIITGYGITKIDSITLVARLLTINSEVSVTLEHLELPK